MPAMQAPRSFSYNRLMPSQASQLPQKPAPTQTAFASHHLGRLSGRRAFDLDLDVDLRRPVKTRWPESDRDLGGKPAGRRFSRDAPGMARGGGPQNPCRITGTPSVSEVPSVGARAFGYFALFKVTRRKGGTNIRHYPKNGHAPGKPNPLSKCPHPSGTTKPQEYPP